MSLLFGAIMWLVTKAKPPALKMRKRSINFSRRRMKQKRIARVFVFVFVVVTVVAHSSGDWNENSDNDAGIPEPIVSRMGQGQELDKSQV